MPFPTHIRRRRTRCWLFAGLHAEVVQLDYSAGGGRIRSVVVVIGRIIAAAANVATEFDTFRNAERTDMQRRESLLLLLLLLKVVNVACPGQECRRRWNIAIDAGVDESHCGARTGRWQRMCMTVAGDGRRAVMLRTGLR